MTQGRLGLIGKKAQPEQGRHRKRNRRRHVLIVVNFDRGARPFLLQQVLPPPGR